MENENVQVLLYSHVNLMFIFYSILLKILFRCFVTKLLYLRLVPKDNFLEVIATDLHPAFQIPYGNWNVFT